MTTNQLQEFLDATKRYRALALRAGIFPKPKDHLMVRLARRVVEDGHPTFYATFLDEYLNGVLATLAKHAHRSVREYRCVAHFAQAEIRRGKRSRD